MFSRFKADKNGGGGGGCGSGAGSSSSQNLLEGNPITTFFEIGRQTATAGPGYLWRIHDAYRKNDGKVNYRISSRCLLLLFCDALRIPDAVPRKTRAPGAAESPESAVKRLCALPEAHYRPSVHNAHYI